MPTLTLPPAVGTRLGVTALAALTAAGATWIAAPTAAAAPGDGADIRIHNERVPYGVSKDDPEVCRFYLDAANFGDVTSVAYTIQAQPPLPTAATVTGTITLAGGAGHTDTLGLADGQYRLTWTVVGGTGPREKVFRVDCHGEKGKHDRAEGPSSPIEDHGQGAGSHDGGPKGGVHAGGGGLVDTMQAYTPLSAAAGVVLVVVGAAAYLRLIRRRSHGAA
ncbi:hypothetical protein [Streptomyces sp. NPDC058335]|uniref:hypothetical protein n=1 Tax=Streptomyces sp. NPDC058335 TaxID=3346451 RepID=UPI003651989A